MRAVSPDQVAASASDPVRAYDVRGFCRAFSIGKTVCWREISAGRLRATRLGRKVLILDEDARRWVSTLPSVTSRPDV